MADPFELVRAALDRPSGFRTMAEAERAVQRIMEDYNQAPQEGLGGLSPMQAQELLSGDWRTTGALRIRTDLALQELAGAPFLVNARAVLAHTVKLGRLPVTATGNLNRAVVAELVEAMDLPEGYLADVREVTRVINELDIFLLHVLRVVLELAGLLRKRRGFLVSSEGKRLMGEERVGELYALLFETFFRTLNLAYMTRGPEPAPLQSGIGTALFKLSQVGGEWRTAEQLSTLVWLPTLLEPVEEPELPGFHCLEWATVSRLLDPLVDFGLMEWLPEGRVPWQEERARQFRLTPLFERFLEFRFGR